MITAQTMITIVSAGETHESPMMDIVELFQSTGEVDLLSFDKKITTGQVSNTRSSSGKDFIYIQVDEQSPLIVTPDARLYDPTVNEWIRATEFVTGKSILTRTGETQTISDVHLIRDEQLCKTYTVTVTPTQCYFANNILIHNHG